MTPNREKIEDAVANILRDRNIKNVNTSIGVEELEYPLVIVKMTDETKESPRMPSDIVVEIVCQSIIGREGTLPKTHYDFIDSVREVLYARGRTGLYSMFWGVGLPVSQVGETIDAGTEIEEEEGGSMATTTIDLNFRLLQ